MKRELHDQIAGALAEVKERHPRVVGKEDSITENLGNAMERHLRGQNDDFEWATRTTVLPSQKKAGREGEPELGADMIIEVSVESTTGGTKHKSILVQGKRPKDSRNKDLREQCEKMGTKGKHIVVEYGDDGYTAIPANAINPVDGTVAKAKKAGSARTLQEALGKDFLNCTLGERDMTYEDGKLTLIQRGAMVTKEFLASVSTRTTIKRRRWAGKA